MQVLSTVEEIHERHDAVKEIERKLLDLHQIYLDMAVLVEAQGDLLDNIESQVCFLIPPIISTLKNERVSTPLYRISQWRFCSGDKYS